MVSCFVFSAVSYSGHPVTPLIKYCLNGSKTNQIMLAHIQRTLQGQSPKSIFYNRDVQILFLTKAIRLFSYGCLSVPLLIYLTEIGIQDNWIGILLTCIMIGDLFITMYLTTNADRLGRKKVLAIGSLLEVSTGVMFSLSNNFYLLMISGIFGVISLSGGDVGPFLSIQQAILTDLIEQETGIQDKHQKETQIARIFGWYNMAGYGAQAVGSLFAGIVIEKFKAYGVATVEAHRIIIMGYAFWGFVKWLMYNYLSQEIEVKDTQVVSEELEFWRVGIKDKEIYRIVMVTSILFALDAFGGGFVINSFMSFWYVRTWKFKESTIGAVLMLCGFMSAWGGIVAAQIVKRIGPMPTIFVTHIPSNVLTMMIPFIPSEKLSVVVLVVRYFTSKMNVSARQTYINTLVKSSQRSSANGISNIMRSLGIAFSPLLLGPLLGAETHSILSDIPFFLGGGFKLLYDILLLKLFLSLREQQSKDGYKSFKSRISQNL